MNKLYKLYEFIFFAYWNPDKDDLKDIHFQTLLVFLLEIIGFPIAAILLILGIDIVVCPTCPHLVNALILAPAFVIIYIFFGLNFLLKKQKFKDRINQKISDGMCFKEYTLSYRIKMISILILIPIFCAVIALIFLHFRK